MVFGLSTWSQVGLNNSQERVGVEDIVEGTIDRLIESSESFIGSDGRPQVDYAPKILQILPGALFSQLREMSKQERCIQPETLRAWYKLLEVVQQSTPEDDDARQGRAQRTHQVSADELLNMDANDLFRSAQSKKRVGTGSTQKPILMSADGASDESGRDKVSQKNTPMESTPTLTSLATTQPASSPQTPPRTEGGPPGLRILGRPGETRKRPPPNPSSPVVIMTDISAESIRNGLAKAVPDSKVTVTVDLFVWPITWAGRGQELRSVLQDLVNQECLDDKTRLVLLDCGGDSSSTTRAKAVKDAKKAVRDSVTVSSCVSLGYPFERPAVATIRCSTS